MLAETPPSGVLYTAIAAMAAAVVAMFKIILSKEKSHSRMIETKTQEHTALTMRVGRLEGRQDGIETLSKQVLEVVHNATSDNGENS